MCQNLKPDKATQPKLDIVPSIDDNPVMCGAPVMMSTPLASVHDKAHEALRKWYQNSVNWVSVAAKQELEKGTYPVASRDMGAGTCRACVSMSMRVRWYRGLMAAANAAFTHVWRGRRPSNAFQERVFSTSAFVRSSLRSRTEAH
ncbi:hypothetical protein GN958_ATG07462 [Phytophthora infestans]|uniref:Uncharacterized protein n=1 Tax=Phytophthora infestans TaxID=4787 RepID=A0A8S9UZ08_PHYIN|nr:hypothetical protein GN958_ATG07462 [Phytophthora infestans]